MSFYSIFQKHFESVNTNPGSQHDLLWQFMFQNNENHEVHGVLFKQRYVCRQIFVMPIWHIHCALFVFLCFVLHRIRMDLQLNVCVCMSQIPTFLSKMNRTSSAFVLSSQYYRYPNYDTKSQCVLMFFQQKLTRSTVSLKSCPKSLHLRYSV